MKLLPVFSGMKLFFIRWGQSKQKVNMRDRGIKKPKKVGQLDKTL